MKKIKYWCDSGANIHSRREGEITLDELGFTEEEWAEMSEQRRANEMQPIACDRLEWGFEEVED